jgi:tRNA (cmo5U34)-methyltransferase
LFANIHSWLRPAGVLAIADQCAGATEDLQAHHMAIWKQQSLQAESSLDEWNMWMRHQAEHDHHDTLIDQMDWLRTAGFSVVDCPWRYLLWCVIQARK